MSEVPLKARLSNAFLLPVHAHTVECGGGWRAPSAEPAPPQVGALVCHAYSYLLVQHKRLKRHPAWLGPP